MWVKGIGVRGKGSVPENRTPGTQDQGRKTSVWTDINLPFWPWSLSVPALSCIYRCSSVKSPMSSVAMAVQKRCRWSPGWASPTVLAGAVTGYGLAGFVATRSGLHPIWAVVLGAAFAALVGFVMISILRTLTRQQGNSQVSRSTFEGLRSSRNPQHPARRHGAGPVPRSGNGVLVTKSAASTWSEEGCPPAPRPSSSAFWRNHVVVSRT